MVSIKTTPAKIKFNINVKGLEFLGDNVVPFYDKLASKLANNGSVHRNGYDIVIDREIEVDRDYSRFNANDELENDENNVKNIVKETMQEFLFN